MRPTIAAATLLALAGLSSPAAAEDDLAGAAVIFARGTALYRIDAKGKNEVELATLPARLTVRALRSDAAGSVLLVDAGGKWSWMPLDGSTRALADLPCADGPAQLANDGACVLCRDAKQPAQSIIVHLKTGKQTPIAIPTAGSRLAGAGAERKLVWADAGGIWSAPPGDVAKKTQVAPAAPLRGFLPSPDGARAVGVYGDFVHDGRQMKPAELLMGFALDGQGARRKGIRNGVPVEWSHDSQWVLVQDGGSACIMRAIGGEYKCWRGYTAASIAPDGSYALVLGAAGKPAPAKASPKAGKGAKAAPPAPKPAPAPSPDEPEGEPEQSGDAPVATDDVAIAPPGGPLSLYRALLAGPYTTPPVLLVKQVDGAAVWIPAPPRP
jgi:hypothetical protein